MINILLTLSLPALRAIAALARGAKNDNDLRVAGVSRSCVADATRELRELGLVCTRPGRCAALGVRGIAAQHELQCEIEVDVDVSRLTLAQARVFLATAGCQHHHTTSELAARCGLSTATTRDALLFLRGTPPHSAPPIYGAPRETVPREIPKHTAEACSSELKTEAKTTKPVLNSREKQQTAVVVNFSTYQKLLENGLANDVAAQLIAQDEPECELQITRIEKLKNMPINRAGYLRKAIVLKYRDFDSKKHEPVPSKKVEEFPFERRTDGCKPPDGMFESLKILLGGAS